jgi:hypothetical protein
MPVRNMDLARAPRRTARKKGSGYENGIEQKERDSSVCRQLWRQIMTLQ